MQRMLEEQGREMEGMQEDFAEATKLMTDEKNSIEAKFAMLQDLYEKRPSRPEDLDMIKDLDEQITQKDAFIKKQEDDMKFYKLELINREHSYNQMFGHKGKMPDDLASQVAGIKQSKTKLAM